MPLSTRPLHVLQWCDVVDAAIARAVPQLREGGAAGGGGAYNVNGVIARIPMQRMYISRAPQVLRTLMS